MKQICENQHRTQQGFTLQEIVVAVTLIGIFSLIALPAFSSFLDKADDAKAKRNAQVLANTAATLVATGDPEVEMIPTKAGLIAYLSSGQGTSKGTLTLPSLTQAEQKAAAGYLEYSNGFLSYSGRGFSGGAAGGGVGDSGSDTGGSGGGSASEDSQWNAQLLASASSSSREDARMASASDTVSAISILVDQIQHPMVVGMTVQEQVGAADYLTFSNGYLTYTGP